MMLTGASTCLYAIFICMFLTSIQSFSIEDQKTDTYLRHVSSPEVDTKMCSYTATCTVSGIEGACVSMSGGCCSGTATSGLCPGSSDIKCCTNNPCSTPYGSGTCKQTSACTGQSYSGYCSGPSDIQCCVSSNPGPAPTPTPPSSSVYGVDISQQLSSSTASCMASNGISFIIPRGYKSTCAVDTNVCTSIKNAAAAGIGKRDAYLFPSPTCSKSASDQMGELLNYLKANCNGKWSGRIWLDVEGTQYWLGDYTKNKNWYQSLVDSCGKYDVDCGVYATKYQWQDIFGSSSYCYGSNLPLWYAHYDNNPSFSDYATFGCWSSPYAKQYAGDTTLCSMGVDKNYSPNF